MNAASEMSGSVTFAKLIGKAIGTGDGISPADTREDENDPELRGTRKRVSLCQVFRIKNHSAYYLLI